MYGKNQIRSVKLEAEVLSQERIGTDVYSMWLHAEEIACRARAGQFVSFYTKDASRLLPRPVSICEISRASGAVRLVYRIAGAGTREFSGYAAGDMVTVLGPLGNGFPEIAADWHALLVGGGIGIPPLLQLAKDLRCRKTAVLGYRDGELFLKNEFERCAEKVAVATEDGSAGTKGNVLDAIRALRFVEDAADVILACGPRPMLRALKDYAAETGTECWLSLEERMACGVGACLSCVCETTEVDAHSNVRNSRVCRDGPVFAAGEVRL